MAKLDTPDSFKTEDFPSKYQDLVSKLFFVLNQFMRQVFFALNKKLSYADNFDCIDTEVELRTPITSLSVRNSLGAARPIRGHTILRVDNLDNTSFLSSAPFIEFTNSGDQIKINNITGLTSNTRYRIRVVFYP